MINAGDDRESLRLRRDFQSIKRLHYRTGALDYQQLVGICCLGRHEQGANNDQSLHSLSPGSMTNFVSPLKPPILKWTCITTLVARWSFSLQVHAQKTAYSRSG